MQPSSPPKDGSAYRGRFAPSPTGPLHAGSLAAALASWLDARAHRGRWLLRIEDLDPPREVPGAAQEIISTLAAFGMEADEPVQWQSERAGLYEAALRRLLQQRAVYGCGCTRAEAEAARRAARLPDGVYAGTCRNGLQGKALRAWRFRVAAGRTQFVDGACGLYVQHLARDVGDFVVRRADGLWAYQLAVVVDDAAQGITDVVRGGDLLDNTPRQIALQRALGVPTPRYLHVPVVVNAAGDKLSKQSGATALDPNDVLGELQRAATHLGLPRLGATRVAPFLQAAVAAWRDHGAPRAAV
jgi:glutamyl-Q tRNA(Asp) synthetase